MSKKNPKTGEPVPQVAVDNGDYPASHDPLCDRNDCHGCDELRRRRMRMWRAAHAVGVKAAKEPALFCGDCEAPGWSGLTEELLVPCWAWLQDVNRASWSIEERKLSVPPPTHCPRCRAARESEDKAA